MTEIENINNDDDEALIPDGIVVLPPVNATDYNTDEDSGDENEVNINNLPRSQLMTEAERCDNSDFDSDDDLPLSSLVLEKKPKMAATKASKPSYKWKEQTDITSSFPEWQQKYGPKNCLSPLELFSLFIDDEVINLIVKFSNLYAMQHNRQGDITTSEIRCFIGILLLSGYNWFPRRSMYWENSNDGGNKLVSSAISRDRFNFVTQNLHLNDNNDLEQNDKFSKLRPLFLILNEKFISLAPFEECHSVDESMVPYYGGHGSKQFIRRKPIRWGYKIWVGTTSKGYIEWFEPYQGCTTIISEKYRPLGLGASIVLQFSDIMQVQNGGAPFHIFCDNFFTSLPLLTELSNRGMKCTGTVRENRLPDCLLQKSTSFKKKIRGTFVFALEETKNNLVCKWNDNSVVTIASNVSSPFPTQQVKRFSREQKKIIQVEQPSIIKKYNENMGGVDRADQNISL
nr:unnamed protein product [Callosobruchus chinensis]